MLRFNELWRWTATGADCNLDAIVYAARSVLIAPNDVISIYVLGRSYLAARMYEEATRSFRRALELEPDFAIARSRLNSLSTRLPEASLEGQ